MEQMRINVSQPVMAPKRSPAAPKIEPVPAEQVASATSAATDSATSEPEAATPTKGSEPRRDAVRAAVSDLNDFIQSTQRSLRFNLDESTSEMVITVVDQKTKEVIRQIPDDVAIDLARRIREGSRFSLL